MKQAEINNLTCFTVVRLIFDGKKVFFVKIQRMTLVAHGKNDTGVKTISGINRFQKVSDIKGVVHGSCSAKISIW